MLRALSILLLSSGTLFARPLDAGKGAWHWEDAGVFESVGGKIVIKPYAIPYRCLYSRNVGNLFLAGKDISATHVAMGSHRVMTTCGAMGTVVARAAALCLERGCLPRGLSEGEGLEALKARLALPVPERRERKGVH